MEQCLKQQCLYSIVDRTRSWLGASVQETAAMHVRNKTDAQEIWNTLLSVFEQSSLQRLYTLFDSFFEISKDSNVFDNISQELQKKDPNTALPLFLLHHRIFKYSFPNISFVVRLSSKHNSKPGTFFATSLTVNAIDDFVSTEFCISDSGTSHHMTANKQHCTTFEMFPIPQRIEIAGKNCILAYGPGSLIVNVCIGNKSSPATLNNEVVLDSDAMRIRHDRKQVKTGRN
ncbi:hypothetical protein RI129_011803 [Pyrocoelia pectoralis]|uniref:Retrovirus-related Pol polyprotein from transposon TNT 1-94-like beta-barrel domain-containing protein n=1 Tax=Pyrocoelia pectoralis TaxID=417401 RepID=A0AAN7V5I0_9COLE